MESPVVVDKPPEYHGNNDRGFPFDEEEGSGAWSELAARHPDIAARLRQRPASATWARKRRPSSQDATDDFGDSFSGFDRFPFDDIPAEFREHFPSHWNRRFSERDEPASESAHHETAAPHTPPPPPPHHQTTATQTEREPEPDPPQDRIPQYGLRNTVDLGQRSAADPSVDADDRTQRSMSAPPDAPRTLNPNMSANQPDHEPANVRHIPIFVEGRDEPVINKNVDFESKPHAPHAPHVDRDQYFADEGPAGFHHPPNFTRAFGTPFNKGFRQPPQPFTQQKAYPQSAFPRAASPQRAHSPKPQHEEHFAKVPVHHEQAPPCAEPPTRAQQKQPPKQPSPQRQSPPPPPPRDRTPPRSQPSPNDPITLILSIQTDVLNLMTEVENFRGAKKDKRYLFLDEMLTRNLIKLDNIETEGKENIRLARKEAIRCIQKCIAVLEAKAESQSAAAAARREMEGSQPEAEPDLVAENGEVEMKEPPEETGAQPERVEETQPPKEEIQNAKREATPKPQEEKTLEQTAASTETQPAADTRPIDTTSEEKPDEQKNEVENKPSSKKKVINKRDKSKDKDSNTEASKDSDKVAEGERVETMQVDDKGDKPMEVDGAASQ